MFYVVFLVNLPASQVFVNSLNCSFGILYFVTGCSLPVAEHNILQDWGSHFQKGNCYAQE